MFRSCLVTSLLAAWSTAASLAREGWGMERSLIAGAHSREPHRSRLPSPPGRDRFAISLERAPSAFAIAACVGGSRGAATY